MHEENGNVDKHGVERGIGNLRSWLRSKFRRISPLILGVLYG